MAFTIRKLSTQSELNLERLQNEHPDFNTNSKTIDFVLSRHFDLLGTLEHLEENLRTSKSEKYELAEQLHEIKQALNAIKKFTDQS